MRIISFIMLIAKKNWNNLYRTCHCSMSVFQLFMSDFLMISISRICRNCFLWNAIFRFNIIILKLKIYISIKSMRYFRLLFFFIFFWEILNCITMIGYFNLAFNKCVCINYIIWNKIKLKFIKRVHVTMLVNTY